MMECCANYLIKPLEVIGSGGFGVVQKIELYNSSQHFSGLYARKIFSPVEDAYREEFLRRFKREVHYQAHCMHTNIVPVVLHNLHGEQPYFVMSLAEGDLISDYRSGLMSDAQKLHAVMSSLYGVNYLHHSMYLHRDIKPSNVLRFSDGTYKISDFGLVKNADALAESELLTKVAKGMGTEKYAAPEVYAGIYSAQSDIYALGVLIEDLNMFNIPGVEQISMKCTMRRPGDRYLHVEQIINDLRQVITRVGL